MRSNHPGPDRVSLTPPHGASSPLDGQLRAAEAARSVQPGGQRRGSEGVEAQERPDAEICRPSASPAYRRSVRVMGLFCSGSAQSTRVPQSSHASVRRAGPTSEEQAALPIHGQVNGRARDGGRACGNLRLRPAQGMAHVLVSDQGRQHHRAHITERIEDALPAPSNDSTRASHMRRPTHGGPSVSAGLSA